MVQASGRGYTIFSSPKGCLRASPELGAGLQRHVFQQCTRRVQAWHAAPDAALLAGAPALAPVPQRVAAVGAHAPGRLHAGLQVRTARHRADVQRVSAGICLHRMSYAFEAPNSSLSQESPAKHLTTLPGEGCSMHRRDKSALLQTAPWDTKGLS